MTATAPDPRPPDAPPSGGGARLGTLDTGPVARSGRGATAAIDASGSDGAPTSGNPPVITVEWWIGAEDRWHRPATDASTRDRLVGGRPVAEARVRIPSGDAVGTVAAGRLDGSPRDAVVWDVHNDSPLPVALAYVVSADRPLVVDAGGIAVPGRGVLRLARPALGWASGSTPEEVLASLDAVEPGRAPAGEAAPHVAAVLVPLPHTAHGVAAFEPDPVADATSAAAPIERSRVPLPDRVVAGWTAHLAGIPTFDPGSLAEVEAYEAAACDLLLGPDGGSEPLVALGRRVEASARLGRTDDPTALADLLDQRRAGGAVGPRGDGRVAATIQFVRALAAWVTAVGPGDVADELVGPLVQAAHWTAAPRRVGATVALVDELGRTAASAWAAAVAVLGPAGQPDAADALRRIVADRTSTRLSTAATAASAPTAPNATHGTPPNGGASGVLHHLERAAGITDDGVLIAPGWREHDAGAAWEAHGIATPWGDLAYAIRWHGERPALLWELEGGTTGPADAARPVVRAPSIDPDWSSTEPRGDALLAAVAERQARAAGNGQTDAPDGGSFS